MGAEVIKIENTERLDFGRRAGSFPPGREGDPNCSAYFGANNCSKKSCLLDLSKPRARELAKEIIRRSDVFVENFAPGVMDRLGLGYQDLKKIKRDIIMASLSGMGQTGPEKQYVAYGPNLSAYSGHSALIGYADGEPQAEHIAWTDWIASTNGAFAILAALYHRAKTGEGQFIDVALSEGAALFIGDAIMEYTVNQRVRRPMGNHDDVMAPHNVYPCQGEDNWVSIAVATDDEWKAFCEAIGNPEWCKQEMFSDRLGRWNNQDELDKLIAEWTINYSPYEVMETMQKAGVAAGPSLEQKTLLEDPHIRERGFFVEIDHPEAGKRPEAGMPFKLSRSSFNYYPAPLLGEHNDYVFGELLGISKDEIVKLIEEGVIR